VRRERIKVLQFVGAMDYGGIETWLMHVLRHIDRDKFQLDFCYTQPNPGAYAPEIESLGGRMVACPLNRKDPLGFARRFRSILREGRYEVVHSHAHYFSGFFLRLARQERVPVRIAHCHSTSDGKGTGLSRRLYHALMRRWIWKHGTQGLAASEDAAQALFGPNWRSDSRFRVLHCGIDLEPFRQKVSRAEVRSELGIPLEAAVIGHVGSFRPAKNHAFLLEIAAELVKLRPGVRFLLVGDGPLRLQMEAKARQLGIKNSVVFAGARSDVPRLMTGAMDAFLFPSIWEGLPVALLEAQAAGLPCVAADSVPVEAAVLPGRVSFVSLTMNASVWVSRVGEILSKGRRESGAADDAQFPASFNIEASCRDLGEVYASGENR
jgi:glycosyltransferase involved in cell wall biosynthesis